MERCFGNIYKNARMVAGLTQERWSEYLGVSPDTVRNYESGRTIPDEETLLCMADISGMKILPYQHLSQKSRIASGILPELEQERGLPEAVLGLLIQIDDFREDGMKELIRIAADGKISEDEATVFELCLHRLRELIKSAYALGYAREEP